MGLGSVGMVVRGYLLVDCWTPLLNPALRRVSFAPYWHEFVIKPFKFFKKQPIFKQRASNKGTKEDFVRTRTGNKNNVWFVIFNANASLLKRGPLRLTR